MLSNHAYPTHEDYLLDMMPPAHRPFGPAEQRALHDAVLLTCLRCGKPFPADTDDPHRMTCPDCREEEEFPQ
jgi:hypothetical protein